MSFSPRDISHAAAEAVFLGAIVFGPLAFGATERWSVIILEVLLYSLAILSVALLRGQETPAIHRASFAVLGVGLIGLIQYSNPVSLSAPAGLTPFTVHKAATGQALPLWGGYAALIFSTGRLFKRPPAIRRFLWAVFLLGAAVSVVGLMQRGQGNTAFYGLRDAYGLNPFGPYTNYDHAASMLALAFFAGSGLLFSHVAKTQRIERFDKRIEGYSLGILIVFLLAVIGYALVEIRSRGAIHAMVIAATIIVTTALRSYTTKKTFAFGGVVLVAAFSMYGFYLSRHRVMLGLEEHGVQSVPFRLALYKNSLEIARDFPIFGTGLASYRYAFPVYQDHSQFVGLFEHAHNDWVELLIQVGAVGLVLYTVAILGVFASAFSAWCRAVDSEARWLGGSCLAAVISFMIHGFVEFSFQTPANAVLFLALLAAAGSCGDLSNGLRKVSG